MSRYFRCAAFNMECHVLINLAVTVDEYCFITTEVYMNANGRKVNLSASYDDRSDHLWYCNVLSVSSPSTSPATVLHFTGTHYTVHSMTDSERKILRRKKRLIAATLDLSGSILSHFNNIGVLSPNQVEEIKVSIE